MGKRKTEKADTEETKRERLPWVERTKQKAERMAAVIDAMNASGKLDKAGEKVAATMGGALQGFAQWLASLPADFKLRDASAPRKSFAEGDEVSIIDELLPLYPCGKGPHKVIKVSRFGGNAETNFRGSKVFVQIATKRGDLVVPGSALE